MNESALTRHLIELAPEAARSGWRCPDAALLAAYAEGRVAAAQRTSLEAHLADCNACLAQVVFLARSPEPQLLPAVPLRLLAQATAQERGSRRWELPALRGALVAALAALVFVLLPQPTHRGVGPSDSPPGRDAIVTEPLRGREATPVAPRLLTPFAGAVVGRPNLELRWVEVPGALFYSVQVLNGEGDIVWEAHTSETRLSVPREVRLEASRRYFAWVEARLPGGISMRSHASAFEVTSP